MKSKSLGIIALFFISPFFSSAGLIEGHVTLKGSPVPDQVIVAAKTRDCVHGGDIKTEFWKLNTNGGLGNVVVWIKTIPKTVTLTQAKVPIAIEQKGCRYIPHVSAVQINEKIKIKNGDATLHNVRGSQWMQNRKGRVIFNLGQPTQGMVSEVSFSEAGFYTLECDVHPWMQAWVIALENPFFSVTDASGHFILPTGIPSGEYEIQAWHEKFLKPLSQTVKITSVNETNQVNFEFVLEGKKPQN